MFYVNASEFDYFDNVWLTITIRCCGNNGLFVLFTELGPIELVMTSHDVPEYKALLQQATSMLIGRIKSGLVLDDLSSVLLDKQSGLAYIGQLILSWILGPGGLMYLNSRTRFLNEAREPILLINSDVVRIPWECLLSGVLPRLDGDVHLQDVIKNFWGTQFAVARNDISGLKSYGNTSREESKKLLGIGVAINPSLRFAEEEKQYFTQLRDDPNNNIRVEFFDFEKAVDFIDEFTSFLHREDLDILHLACHAKIEANPLYSYLDFANGRKYRLFHLEAIRRPLGASLVFLNACSTSIDKPLETLNFVDSFQKRKNVVSVIATENLIESQVSGRFAIEFYEHFLRGNYVAKSLLATRRHILGNIDETREIVTLFYSLHGNPLYHCKELTG